MTTTFEAFKYVGPLRHLDSMSLLSFRDALRNEKLSIQKPKLMLGGDVTMVGAGTVKLVSVIDTKRIKEGVHMRKTSAEDAMDYHIAVNILLVERGFTSRIDQNPELTIDLV